MQYPEYVAKIIDRLESCGFEAYIVGGSVRDALIGKEPYDFDVTTSALPADTLKVFEDLRTIPTGLKHGTVTVISSGKPIEVTTFRIDGEYTDSRHPDSVAFTDDITADLSRRDFTVNAMAYNQKRGLIDPFGGQSDLRARIIRAVGDPEKRFREDALRIMRAFRFSAQLGFDIEENTLNAARALSEGLGNIARERISVEFLKLICSQEPSRALGLMADNDILRYVLGEYTPSTRVCDALSRARASEHVRLGILLCECPEDTARRILASLRLSNKLAANTITVAKKLSSPICGDEIAARRFIGGVGDLCDDVLNAARALEILDEDFAKYVTLNLSKNICTTNSDLAVNGSHLVKIGIKGKAVGRTLDYLLEQVIEVPERNDEDTLIAFAKQFNNSER